MHNVVQNIRYALRQMRKSPGFVGVALLTLALGIGPNVAIFSVVWAVFLAPLPYPNAKQVVVIWTNSKGQRNPCRADDYLEYLRQSKSFQHLDFFSWSDIHMTSTDPSEEPPPGNLITSGFLTKTIGMPLLMGRDFLPEEAVPGNDHVVILRHYSWVNRFHSDPNILGKQVQIEGKPYTVIGVDTPGLHDHPGDSEFIVPLALDPGAHNSHWGNIFGRLKPGVTPAQAQAELNLIDKRLPAGREGVPKEGWNISVEPIRNDWLDKKLKRNLWLLLGAVGFVLLIACTNITNLLLARGTARQREIAVRSAIGASRRHVLAQLFTESLMLGLLGGALGLAVGWALIKLVVAIQPGLFAQVSEAVIELNTPVLIFAVGASLLAGILAGCAPAWRASKHNLTETLNQGSQSVLGGRRGRVQGLLVTAEFALAITLLAGAGMAIHSFWKLTHIDVGFRKDHIVVAWLRWPNTQRPSPDQISSEARQLIERVRAIPGMRDASISTTVPLDGGGSFPFKIAGQPDSGTNKQADFESVTPSFFETFGVRLLKGRLLNETDIAGSTPVVVVSDEFVRHFLPTVDPLTQRLVTNKPEQNMLPAGSIEWQIVGVFHNMKNRQSITDKSDPEAYVSFWQAPFRNPAIAALTSVDSATVTKSLRAAIVAAGPWHLRLQMETIEKRIDYDFQGERFGTVLFGGFATVALLLAAVGVYGVMAFAVAQRRHEIGLRLALGAQREQVVNLILADGVRLALAGIVLGLVGVFVIGRLMRSTLYGVQTFDLQSFVAVAAVLVIAAVIASYVPARRSAKVDPMVALRYE
jgi:putative ABC transport system permease protein